MKGLVFTEFIEMVDNKFGFETCERLLERSELPSGGVYTSVGTYDPQEMVSLVTNLAGLSGLPVPDLLKHFGRHLFQFFLVAFPAFFEGIKSSQEFLPRVNDYVHQEVQKLYPGAETPEFLFNIPAPGQMIMTYRSKRNLPDLAEGLLLACFDHFGESFTLRRENGEGNPPDTLFYIASK